MNLTALFDEFMVNEVNLNQGRIDTLNGRLTTVSRFLLNSDWEPEIVDFSPQGSWAHGTIIKPVEGKGYDADLIVFVTPVVGFEPRDYVLSLKRVFTASDRYAEMASMTTRCVTLEYKGDTYLDLVPCVINRQFPGQLEVCNRTDNVFEPTNPIKYTEWLAQRNAWTGANRLREVTRLVKYLRDIKGTFSAKSILLTTLLGNRVLEGDAANQQRIFADIPTALKTLFSRLDLYLRANPNMPTILNPTLQAENFNRHWDHEKYENFREKIAQYREWIDDAYDEQDRDESIAKWRRVFGDEFAKGEAEKRALSIRDMILDNVAAGIIRDSVEAVTTYGKRVLGRMPRILPHVHEPRWKQAPAGAQLAVNIRASIYTAKKTGNFLQHFESGDPIAKELGLKFEAISNVGTLFPAADYDVWWRVVNTDKEAAAAKKNGGLRGGFEKSDEPSIRWEYTSYRGVHWVEAFVIRKRDKLIVGQSAQFFVVVQ